MSKSAAKARDGLQPAKENRMILRLAFLMCGVLRSLCCRFGHDPAHFLRGWIGREALLRDVAWQKALSAGDIRHRRVQPTPLGTGWLSPNAWTAPVDVECPRPRGPSATPRPSEGPLGRSARDGNEPIVSTSDTKARSEPTPTKENRMIPRFIWRAKEHWRSFVTNLDILARDHLRCVVSARCRARRGVPRP